VAKTRESYSAGEVATLANLIAAGNARACSV
jgi:hypothetical protein